jgi:hypothetical protein
LNHHTLLFSHTSKHADVGERGAGAAISAALDDIRLAAAQDGVELPIDAEIFIRPLPCTDPRHRTKTCVHHRVSYWSCDLHTHKEEAS